MRLSEPRVQPLEPDEWDDKTREVMAPFAGQGRVFNVFKTLAHHPDLLRRWLVFANHVLGKSTLAVRDRELVILRIGYLCQAGYEWGQHVEIARRAGMSDEEIRSAKTGPDTPGIPELDRLLLAATDELHADAHVTDSTWGGLSAHLTTQQLMDLVFTVGQYNLVSMALNTLGVQLDEGLPGWDV
jgi:alkylhydroperoxidase family enzyme